MKKNSPQRYPEEDRMARSMEFVERSKPKEEKTSATPPPEPVSLVVSGAVHFRTYQWPVFMDRYSGVMVLHWSRQIGKSFTLAAWAVDRLISRPGRLVTVLSNSRDNGAEFLNKCVHICNLNNTQFERVDESKNLELEAMRMELRIVAKGQTGRIKVLAANPRTARGFSGDLILDEFAFHEDSSAIWEAAEPILASNKDFLCRIASTGNGRHNMFYRLAAPAAVGRDSALRCSSSPSEASGDETNVEAHPPQKSVPSSLTRTVTSQREVPTEEDANAENPPLLEGPYITLSQSNFALSRVTRSQAHSEGVLIFDARTREAIQPEQARAQALDKRAYDQNYECSFADESLTLLSHDLISAAECENIGEIAERDWTASQLALLRETGGPLYAGFDVARKSDLSVISVLEKSGETFFVRAILRIRDMRLPDQQERLGEICRLKRFRRAAIDMTGLGLGLFEFAQKEFGSSHIQGVNFSTSVPATDAVEQEGGHRERVRVTEALAMEMLHVYEERRIRQPRDAALRDDLRKPERITTPGGRVSIAATRDSAGHADHFWSFALAIEAVTKSSGPFHWETFKLERPGASRRILI